MPSFKRKPIDLQKVKTYSILHRRSKVNRSALAGVPKPNASFSDFIDTLPQILRSSDLIHLAQDIISAKSKRKSIIFMMGAHVIKCGLSPLIIELMRKGFITTISMNGAAAIHDFELAVFGKTSEDVDESLVNGSFGMALETGKWINESVSKGTRQNKGLGQIIGQEILKRTKGKSYPSVLASADKFGIPATIHVAIGTDIIHQHPSMDGAAFGKGSFHDFRLLAAQLPGLNKGGVVLNVGSAVIMPEVFLKTLSISRNLGNTIENFTTANFDMIRHYRPSENVLRRPTLKNGHSFNFIGHHEIMIPLLFSTILTFHHRKNS